MAEGKEVPEILYRGIGLTYTELKDFTFTGIDIELPYEPLVDEQGRKTVRDGNEYGIYMSDNPRMVLDAYGNANNRGGGEYVEPRVVIGGRGDIIKTPDVGITYKINTRGLDIRTPWISNFLQGVYNNGYNGNEWITDRIPAENYELMQIMIGEDMLHDATYIELDDIEHIKDRTIEVMEQRKARLEVFANEMSMIPEQTRKDFTLTHMGFFREIYGENGFRYMDSFEEIDTSTDVGMIRYLMAKVYERDKTNIDFSTLAKLEDVKENIIFSQKWDKKIDIRDLIKDETLLDLMSEKEKLEKGEHIVDYYEKYGINPEDDIEAINKQLRKIQRKWINRQNSTDPSQKETFQMIEQELTQLDVAMQIFDSKNPGAKAKYDERLRRQKEASERQEVEEQQSKREDGTETPRKSGISVRSVSTAIRKKPVSLARLKEVQQEIGEQVQSRSRQAEPVINYYEKYGITQGEEWQSIKKKIGKQIAEWERHKGNVGANSREKSERCDRELAQLHKARRLFSPGHEDELMAYNELLSQEKTQTKQSTSTGIKRAENKTTGLGLAKKIEER